MEPVHKDLKTLLADALQLKDANHSKLSQLTGIPERYLWAIQNLEIDKLPPAPYVRGYLKKISEVLNINHDELWELYKKEFELKQSGEYDKLPTNRFAIKHLSRKIRFLILLGIFLLLYLIFGWGRLMGKPNLIIANPAESIITTGSNLIVLSGGLNQRDKLLINGEEIFISREGKFANDFALQPGLNTVEFKAKRLLGKEVTIIKQIIYQPQ